MSAASILRLEGVSKSFRGLRAIAEVSFAIEAGSITSIIGPNGAGKSTLFNLVTGYLAPTAGEISFKDRRITGMATNRIAELGVARAFQIARPFRDLTVFENVRIGALFGKAGVRDVEVTVRRSLQLAAIAHLAEQPANTLTVGQLRHLEVARAIATRADLLLADEPCAGLNPTETAAMIDVLRLIRDSGVTVVLVEHDMPSVMEVSDRVLVLDAGALIADGPPHLVASNPQVIAAYLGTPDPSPLPGHSP
ncbi:branched-chain amino acid transport system ATP-binding protein [Enhydrobacter aerosaccus]|uniref:Branched-chain amino acid transport system ATP-binding protein n=1 Tax=Enhydrobacter aerosaccus TaxID=225324 RepID=A0A1T4RXA8_9HYPH|nr:ABC transporter ATP-binding protein [Enhydrobacter aerosaccus]SKA20537.1 branched-chain amino acid transport system ATP-binding protein [Enhydrobacter aerosaccus]